MGTIEKEPLKGLLATVKNGTGMAGRHGGMGDAYRQETEYRYMVGGDWVAHPGGIIEPGLSAPLAARRKRRSRK
jgi:uncharacterized protein